MSRTRTVVTTLATTAVAVGALAGPAAAAPPVQPATHSAATWAAMLTEQYGFDVTCSKEEFEDGHMSHWVGDALFVYVKAGTGYSTLDDAVDGYITPGKDISFVITCDGEPDYPPIS
ncbi:hypothetical protein [Cellulomonas carbonis]|uniref:Uncharacterized protein n=1 Tax=Cellulomonas carbonis T26 TaxID=947969 RepID=A0A0A0BUY0_9CELL|nr:hypothetical protein [Cellulomonas carbonis]KGM11750.1 hypothetical protein N868_07525 [Cellulomonas carbonis T26]GGB94525.1 hypothetical protein GCM10010972_04000 [Cellulomonas carbonis]